MDEIQEGIAEYQSINIIDVLDRDLVTHVAQQLSCDILTLGAYEHNHIGELIFTTDGTFAGYLSDYLVGFDKVNPESP